MTAEKHILVFRFSSMGDVAMTVPVVKALLAQNPFISVTFVSRPGFREFFADIPRLSFFEADLNKQYKGFRGILKLYADLNKNGSYDAVADLHDNLRTKILRNLFRLTGKPIAAVDKGRAEKKLLTRFPNKILRPLERTIDRYADVFEKLGFNTGMDYKLINEPQSLVQEITAITGGKAKPWIGITPFAQYKGKTFPIEKMEEVISLLARNDLTVFLFGGTAMDEEICAQWEMKYKSVISMVRKISMEQELALISNLNVMLSMDSAGMHLASLRGVPVVSIWGATHHYAGFLGYGQSENNIIAHDIECRPCSVYGNKPCFRKDYACLYNIAPQTVVNSLLQFV